MRIGSLWRATVLIAVWVHSLHPAEVLIVSDEHPQMEVLAEHFHTQAGFRPAIIEQPQLPADLSPNRAVVVFIHKVLEQAAEERLIEYARDGGRLILLHHSISQGKGKNQYWFPSLGMTLRPGEIEDGGYKWIHGVNFSIVNLAPNHYITSHQVKYDEEVDYQSPSPGGPQGRFPAFLLRDTEVFVNHGFTDGEEKTVLLGLKYVHEPAGVTYMQDRAGWYKPAGKGWVMYFMPGHTTDDFRNETYLQILVNAVTASLP